MASLTKEIGIQCLRDTLGCYFSAIAVSERHRSLISSLAKFDVSRMLGAPFPKMKYGPAESMELLGGGMSVTVGFTLGQGEGVVADALKERVRYALDEKLKRRSSNAELAEELEAIVTHHGRDNLNGIFGQRGASRSSERPEDWNLEIDAAEYPEPNRLRRIEETLNGINVSLTLFKQSVEPDYGTAFRFVAEVCHLGVQIGRVRGDLLLPARGSIMDYECFYTLCDEMSGESTILGFTVFALKHAEWPQSLTGPIVVIHDWAAAGPGETIMVIEQAIRRLKKSYRAVRGVIVDATPPRYVWPIPFGIAAALGDEFQREVLHRVSIPVRAANGLEVFAVVPSAEHHSADDLVLLRATMDSATLEEWERLVIPIGMPPSEDADRKGGKRWYPPKRF
jgi:hypothetical protein